MGKRHYLRQFWNAGESAENGITEDDVDPRQLRAGTIVEYEHTTMESMARKIALDHLAEKGGERYYSLLSIIEQVMEQGRTDEFLEVIDATMDIESEV